MKPTIVLAAAAVLVTVAYGLDHGIFVGTKRYVLGPAPCCPSENVTLIKRCRYLFVTGVSEIDAEDGRVSAPSPVTDAAAYRDALSKPENGYCRLFGK